MVQHDPARPSADDHVAVISAQWRAVRPDLDVRGMDACARMYRFTQLTLARLDKAFAGYGITRGEFDVLAALRRSGGPYSLAPRDLSAGMMVTSGGMTGRLDKLERAGLVVRSPDPRDRRALKVTLTERGLELIDRAIEDDLAVYDDMLDALDEEQREQLVTLLTVLTTDVEKR